MAPPKFAVTLSADERATLLQMVRAGTRGARALTRARVLLKADEGLSDPEVAAILDVGVATVHRIRQRCVEEGFAAALRDRPRQGGHPQVRYQTARARRRARLQRPARGPHALDAAAPPVRWSFLARTHPFSFRRAARGRRRLRE